jgi:hypothetical protein
MIGARISDDRDKLCWLCGRPLGHRVEWHHPLPKSRGGRETVPLHPICHRTIHAHLSNAELARLPAAPEALRGHPDSLPHMDRRSATRFPRPDPSRTPTLKKAMRQRNGRA